MTIRALLCIVSAAILSGCYNGVPLPISPTYTPDTTAQAVVGAEKIPVSVEARDSRANKAALGTYNPGFGSRPFVTSDDLAALLKSGVESELRDRGFELKSSGTTVLIDLQEVEVGRFVTPENLFGSEENRAAAMVVMNVTIKRLDGVEIYGRKIAGQSRLGDLSEQTASSGAQMVLNYALNKAVRTLMADPKFIQALMASPSVPAKPERRNSEKRLG